MSLKNAVVTVAVDGEQKEKFIINMPNIRKLQGFLKGQWDLSVYDDCFPKRNRLGDVDGSIELNGHTIHIEFKESRYGMTQGQVLKAINQAVNSNITTMFIFGKKDIPIGYILFTKDNLQPDYFESDVEGIKTVLKDWARMTEANNLNLDRTALWKLTDKYAKGA